MHAVGDERNARRRIRFEWERALSGSHVPAGARRVGRALAEFSNSTTGANCHPGVDRLAGNLGVDRRTVIRNLAILRDEGWIQRTAKGGAGPGRGHIGKPGMADTYRLVIPAADGHQGVPSCRYCRAECAAAEAAEANVEQVASVSGTLKPVTFLQETRDKKSPHQ